MKKVKVAAEELKSKVLLRDMLRWPWTEWKKK